MVNFNKIKGVAGGYSTDLLDNIERKDTYQKAIGGRIYSDNGVMSFSGGKGTKLVYQNSNIVKYLGSRSFKDELIVFAKVLKGVTLGGNVETICSTTLYSNSFTIVGDANSATPISLTTEITDNSTIGEDCYDIETPADNPIDFDPPFTSEGDTSLEIDLSEYYQEDSSVPNKATCDLNKNEVPMNNLVYNDAIYSFRIDSNYNLIGTLLWVGIQNWPLEGKITTEGVHENQFYKRVYYTDAVNQRRVVNLKDPSLSYRLPSEFNQILNNVLLQPEIVSVVPGGQLKSMKALYVYRIISENGQVSEFSPSSFYVDILPENTPIDFRGGDISESTGKSVKIKCNILNFQRTSEIECIALEYEAFGPPTAIKSLGIKSASAVVEFQHFGSEAEFADAVTYNDIINFKNTWKYCNDFNSKKNKLIAGGLRNEPLSTEINNLEYLFPLHSWKPNGETHDSLINPEPWNYRHIDPSNEDDLIYIKEKVYRNLSSFGPLIIKLVNVSTSDEISLTLSALSLESYTDITDLIIAWLLDQKANNTDWDTFFPNLNIQDVQGQLLFTPTIPATQTDMSNYIFQSNNSQFVENFDNNIVFLPVTIDINNLVYGAQSLGFNKGTGVRVTYREFKEPLLNQATAVYDGSGAVLDFIEPTFEKYCMKGEIYRLAFNAFNNDSTRLFAIPIGDIMIPNLGDLKSSIDDSGNAIITSQQYVNQSVENGILYGHGIKMHIEVRLSCELQSLIPMYQMVYVERDEENRTIICQGISAPMNRVQENLKDSHKMPDPVRNKWNLPYYGGPTYEKNGFDNYDAHGENDQYTGDGHERRIITHRGMMYFDSPDLYYGKVSDQHIGISQMNIVAKLNTDHTPEVIRERGSLSGSQSSNDGIEVYPKFSRKIYHTEIEGDNHTDNHPRYDFDQRSGYSGTDSAFFINVSVLANYRPHNDSIGIDKAVELKRGELVSGASLGVDNAISNNTFGLSAQPWYYGSYQRNWQLQSGRATAEVFKGAMTSLGYKTIVIKTDEDLFTDEFIGDTLPVVNNQIRNGGSQYGHVYDTFPLINLFRNNRESVYGGRSIDAYSKNTYIPLSRTTPTLQSSNATQHFDVGADVYITLNIRNKNDFGDDEIKFYEYNNHGDAKDDGELDAWTRNAAWCYAVVLETQVEPKLSHNYEFYRQNGIHSFQTIREEFINPAYFNENILKSYVPKPFKFKDDPDRGSVIAVSDVKLAGDYFDAWTLFKPNNFYPLLEKNKGDISNFVKEDEELFAIQEQQTSLLYIGTDRIITDSNGSPINIQQGSGSVVDGHKVISNYGTSIRRAVVESDYGFCFFDDRKIEFVKIKAPLLVQNLLHLEYFNKFKTDKIIDTEAYFDHEHKETCIRIRTESGNNFMLSYNEVVQKFNGEFPIAYDKDIFMEFDEKIYAPIRTLSGDDILSQDLHQLNEGDVLKFFNQQTDLVIGFYINADINKVFQYKNVGIVTNLSYPITSIFGKSNLGYDRTILGTHNWYKIREGTHTVPMINETNLLSESSDIRGAWVYIEITAKSLNKNKVNILAVLNDLRYSHQ